MYNKMLSISEDHGFRSLSRKCCQKTLGELGEVTAYQGTLSPSLSVSLLGAIADLRSISWNLPHLTFPVFNHLPSPTHLEIGGAHSFHFIFCFLCFSRFFKLPSFSFCLYFVFCYFDKRRVPRRQQQQQQQWEQHSNTSNNKSNNYKPNAPAPTQTI